MNRTRVILLALMLTLIVGACSETNPDPDKGKFNRVYQPVDDGTGLPNGDYGNDAARFNISSYELPDGTSLKCISGMDHGLSCDWDHRVPTPTTTSTTGAP